MNDDRSWMHATDALTDRDALSAVRVQLLHDAEASGIPYVTLSFGMSLDGKIATRTGDSKYISGPASRVFVHRLRDLHDGILVGINTILADHPKLTTRLPESGGRDAVRVILDSTLRIPLEEPLLTQVSSAGSIVVTNRGADAVKKARLVEKGVGIVEVTDLRSPAGLREALGILRNGGIGSLLVEGGSTIHFSFLRSGFCRRVFATVAPLLIGGDAAKTAVGGLGFATLAEATRLEFVGWREIGSDLVIEAVPAGTGTEGSLDGRRSS